MPLRSLSREEVRQVDEKAIAMGLPGVVLMENAALGLTDVVCDELAARDAGPGAVVGELAPLTGGVRTATVTADSAMEVLVIAQREFNGLIEEVPGFAVQLLRNLAARMTDES